MYKRQGDGGDSGGGDSGGDSGEVPVEPGESDREVRAWFRKASDWISAHWQVPVLGVVVLVLLLIIWIPSSSSKSSRDSPVSAEAA